MIEFVPETGSTSADLAARLRAGELVAEGSWLVADRQTAGRGRQGRNWSDGAGNFMGSTVVHARFGDPAPGTLALLAGIAVHQTVSPLLPAERQPVLKWPNDVKIGDAKLVGVLLERVGDSVVIGIGVNLAAAPELPDRATVALSAFAEAPDRDRFATDLARVFDLELARWRDYGLAPIIARWLAAAHPLGTPLNVEGGDAARVHGTFAGLAADGTLQLRLPDGTTRIIQAGEVRFAAAGH